MIQPAGAGAAVPATRPHAAPSPLCENPVPPIRPLSSGPQDMPHPAAFAEGAQVTHSPLTPPLPGPGQRIQWGRLYGASPALALAAASCDPRPERWIRMAETHC